MVSLTDLADRLSDYGITHNQARVYIAAAKLVIASVSQISKKSNVPREEVYRLLPELEKLGLIEKTVERPMRIKATDFRSALSILINHEKDGIFQKISKLEKKRDQILKDFRTIKLEPKSEETAHLTMIMQRQAIIQKVLSMMETAKKTVCLFISRDHAIHLFNNYSLQIKKALSRDIEFRIILKKAEYDDTINELTRQFESSRIFEIRFVNQQQNHYYLIDNKEALVSTAMDYNGLGNAAYLWTDDDNLIKLFVENFEITWSKSQDIETLKTEDYDEKLKHCLNTLKPTEHLLFIYRSLEAKYYVLSNYLKVGLENGEAAVYITSEDNDKEVKGALERFGVDVEKNEEAGALRILRFNEFYIIDGKFSISTTTHLLKRLHDNAVEKGFRGCRVFGEVSCFFQHDLNNELIEYEKAVHRILDSPIIAMCAYNADDFDKCDSATELYNELLKTHRTVLFMGRDKNLEKFEIR